MANGEGEEEGIFKKQTDSAIKAGQTALKDEAKKKAKQAIVKKIAAVIAPAIPYILIALVAGVAIIMLAAALYSIKDDLKELWEGLKDMFVITASAEEGAKSSSINIIKDGDNYFYSIFSEDVLKDLQEKGNDLSKLNNIEIFRLLLKENGYNDKDFSDKQIETLIYFYAAEIATQKPDLRKTTDIYDGENVKTVDWKDIEKGTTQGTIRLKRTSTNGDKYNLEYIPYDTFENYIKDNATEEDFKNIIDKFSIDGEGNIVVAKWKYHYQKYEYSESFPEEDRNSDVDKYIITEEKINYSSKVSQYIMPYGFLVSLYAITENEDFCLDVANLAFNNNIVIAIYENYEERNEPGTKTTYTEYERIYKSIKYRINPIQSSFSAIELGDNNDEEGKIYVIQNENIRSVTEKSKHISNTYSIEISYVDNWKLTYSKEMPESKEDNSSNDLNNDFSGEWEETQAETEITDSGIINSDEHVKAFKISKEANYYATPTVSISGTGVKITCNTGISKINSTTYTNQSSVTISSQPEQIEITDEYGNMYSTTRYNSGASTYYSIPTLTYRAVYCEVNPLKIRKTGKTDIFTEGTENIIKYKIEEEPKTETKAKVIDKDGNFEGFLKVYDETPSKFQDTRSWFYEYLEKSIDQATKELVDYMKYLFYIYDNPDKYDENDEMIQKILEGAEPTNLTKININNKSSWDQFLEFLHSWEGGGEIYQNSEGEQCYKVIPDGGGGSAVGYGVDIATHGEALRNMGYETSIGSLIPVSIVNEIESKTLKETYDKILERVNGLDLTEYQTYALLSRCYNYGVAGGTGQATSYFKYPSEYTFKEAYQAADYSSIKNEELFGDYTKVDFDNDLFKTYMKWLDYASSGTHPEGWEHRRKSEWCLFQTGYYGYDLKFGTGHGMDEYWGGGINEVDGTDFTNGISLYNADGSVNSEAINELDSWLTNDVLNTVYHYRTSEKQTGPFAKWWDSENNWFTSAGYKFQCTWYAFGRANQYLENFGTKYKLWPGTRNNAWYWFESGKDYFESDSTPLPNSLAVWEKSDGAGHVAYVEAVDTVNNQVYISHAGSGKSWFGVQKFRNRRKLMVKL